MRGKRAAHHPALARHLDAGKGAKVERRGDRVERVVGPLPYRKKTRLSGLALLEPGRFDSHAAFAGSARRREEGR